MENLSKRSKLLLTAAITSLFLLIPLTVFIISIVYKHPKPQKISITFPTPTPNPYKGWQTFTNKPYGYEIQYPKNWSEKYLPFPESKTILDAQYFNDGKTVDYVHNIMSLVVTNEPIETAKKILSYEEKITGLKTVSEISLSTIEGKEITKALITTTQLDPEKNAYVETGKSYQIFIPLKQNTLTLHANVKDKDLADKMLATFRFLQ